MPYNFMYDIDRKTASKLLKVSIRTVDRYIGAGKLSSETKNGRIWLNKNEIIQLRKQKRVDSRQNVSTSKMSMDNIDVIPVDMSTDSQDTVYQHKSDGSDNFSAYGRDNDDQNVYRKLFEELQQELKQKQERLEAANYRVGQLESLIKESVPLLDYNRALALERSQKADLEKNKAELSKNLDAKNFENEQLHNSLKDERFNKKVYLILLFILLLLQPLWFIFPLQ